MPTEQTLPHKHDEKIICKHCGASFERRIRQPRRGARPPEYCSVKCRNEASYLRQLTSVKIRICSHCGGEFETPQRKPRKYCGDDCKNAAFDARREEKLASQKTTGKVCPGCGSVYPPTPLFFSRNSKTFDGLCARCKTCDREMAAEYKRNNPQKIKERDKRHTKRRVADGRYSEQRRKYLARNPERVRRLGRRRARRFCENPTNRISKSIRCQILSSIGGNKAGRTWESIVGYTLDDLTKHLESRFEDWMNWDNFGTEKTNGCRSWQIHHVIPVAEFSFVEAGDAAVKQCWALENLTPLDEKLNQSIGADRMKSLAAVPQRVGIPAIINMLRYTP